MFLFYYVRGYWMELCISNAYKELEKNRPKDVEKKKGTSSLVILKHLLLLFYEFT